MSEEVRTNVPLAPLTTFSIGGVARELLRVETVEEAIRAASYARRAESAAILGGGSNLLVPDAGVDACVIQVAIPGIAFEEVDEDSVRMVLGAGVLWDAAVEAADERVLWGVSNLAGIPGTVGGAAVQNIGAYGAELAQVFEYAEVIDLETGLIQRVTKSEAAFDYRNSMFKQKRSWLILRVALRLRKAGTPNLAYKDLQKAAEAGTPLTSPSEIAQAVRAIRAQKFPDLAREGTAGSFFKNPIILQELADSLIERYPGLPQFPVSFEASAKKDQPDKRVKVSLAWLLDNVLRLKGLSVGNARLFERQPLVIAAAHGTRAEDVETLARTVEEKVFAATNISIEREVETFASRKLSTHPK